MCASATCAGARQVARGAARPAVRPLAGASGQPAESVLPQPPAQQRQQRRRRTLADLLPEARAGEAANRAVEHVVVVVLHRPATEHHDREQRPRRKGLERGVLQQPSHAEPAALHADRPHASRRMRSQQPVVAHAHNRAAQRRRRLDRPETEERGRAELVVPSYSRPACTSHQSSMTSKSCRRASSTIGPISIRLPNRSRPRWPG